MIDILFNASRQLSGMLGSEEVTAPAPLFPQSAAPEDPSASANRKETKSVLRFLQLLGAKTHWHMRIAGHNRRSQV